MLTYLVVFVYLLILMTTFGDGSKQYESQSVQVFDRYSAGNFSLAEYNLNLTIFSTFYLPPEIGRMAAYQSVGGVLRQLEFETCKNDRRKKILDYWSARGQDKIANMPAFYLQCLDTKDQDSAFIASEEFFKTDFA